MARYRHRQTGQVVDATLHLHGFTTLPLSRGFPDQSLTYMGTVAIVKTTTGPLQLWSGEDLGREYERVEEGDYVYRFVDLAKGKDETVAALRERVEEKEFLNDCVLCDKPVFKGDDPAYDFGQWYHRACREKAYRIKHENEVERARELLAREDAAAEKPKPLHCQRCGVNMDALFRYSVGTQHCLCYNCYCALKAEERGRKPTPLTLGSLTPGDVFVWRAEKYTKRQVLSRDYYFVPENPGMTAFLRMMPTNRHDEVTRVSRHPLTPAQLLWIDATPEERAALEESIRDKGLPILRGEKQGSGVHDCPLCRMFRDWSPDGGVVISGCYNSESRKSCLLQRSPLRGCVQMGHSSGMEHPDNAQTYRDARAFWLRLAELLPDIHPARIEVEATPEEWPGKK